MVHSNMVLSSTPRPPPVGLPDKILKALLHSYILATCPAHLNLLDLITLTILGNGTNHEVPHFGAFSTPHSYSSWAQIFASELSEIYFCGSWLYG